MSDLVAVLNRLHQTNLKSSNLLELSERQFGKLKPWPAPTRISVRRLKSFGRFDIPPTKEQLRRAAGSYVRCCLPGPVIVNDEKEVLLGQLRVAAISEHFGSQSRVETLRYSQLSKAQLTFLVRDMGRLISGDGGWDRQMLLIDAQGLTALVSKAGALPRMADRVRSEVAPLRSRD